MAVPLAEPVTGRDISIRVGRGSHCSMEDQTDICWSCVQVLLKEYTVGLMPDMWFNITKVHRTNNVVGSILERGGSITDDD